jgi:hypothetical protein
VLFTDYSPEREQPLKTELRVASCQQNLDAFADDWLAANIKRGWVAASSFRRTEEDAMEDQRGATPVEQPPIAAAADDDPVVAEPSTNPGPWLTITFARSSSPTFARSSSPPSRLFADDWMHSRRSAPSPSRLMHLA